jgi:hypothetical protein
MAGRFDTPPNGYDEQYQEYLASPAFAERTAESYEKWGGAHCQGCLSAADVQAHHITFERYGHEKPKDLVPLCEDCHNDFLSNYYGKGWYKDLPTAFQSYLEQAKRKRKKFVLLGHDDQGEALLRKRMFRDRFTWLVKLSWPKRILAILGILVGVIVAIPVAFYLLPAVAVILIAAAGFLIVGLLIALVGVVMGSLGLLGGAGAAAGGQAAGAIAQAKPAPKQADDSFWGAFTGNPNFREHKTPDWKYTKTLGGETIIHQDKVGATWAYKGDTYYKFHKTLAGETILKAHKW